MVLTGTLVAAVTGLVLLLQQPMPPVPPAPQMGGVLALISVPQVGPAWVELGEARRDQSRPVLAIRSIHPTVRIFPDHEQLGRKWRVSPVHELGSQENDAEMIWTGQSFRHVTTSGNTNTTVLTPEPVTGLRSIESNSRFYFGAQGMGIDWSSRRPEWIPASPLDQKVRQDSDRLEAELWKGFSETIIASLGNRPKIGLFNANSMSVIWQCELWQVVYHRSPNAVSVLHGQYQYLGDAHGRRHVAHSNFIQGPTGIESLDFAALFVNPMGWQGEVKDRLMEELRRQGASWVQPEGPPTILEKSEAPTLELSDGELATLKFTASSAGVFVHFEEYEAGTYAEGEYMVLLPWKTLAPWVRPEVVEAFTTDHALPEDALESPGRSFPPRSRFPTR